MDKPIVNAAPKTCSTLLLAHMIVSTAAIGVIKGNATQVVALLSRHLNSDSCMGFVELTFSILVSARGRRYSARFCFEEPGSEKRPFMAGEWNGASNFTKTFNLLFG